MEAINTLADMNGVLVAMGGERSVLTFAFNPSVSDEDRTRWKNAFNSLVVLLDLATPENEVRLVVSNQIMALRHSGTVYVGVVVQQGHPVVKSLQRTVRRLLKKLGAPVDRTDPRPVTAPSVLRVVSDPSGRGKSTLEF